MAITRHSGVAGPSAVAPRRPPTSRCRSPPLPAHRLRRRRHRLVRQPAARADRRVRSTRPPDTAKRHRGGKPSRRRERVDARRDVGDGRRRAARSSSDCRRATSGSDLVGDRGRPPDRRTPIVVPFADLDLGPASADGSILATTAAQVLTVTARRAGADHDVIGAAARRPRAACLRASPATAEPSSRTRRRSAWSR